MRIAVELVPRDAAVFESEVKQIKMKLPEVDFINVPDLLSCDIRSWQAAGIAGKYFKETVPHLRAMDFDFSQPFPLKQAFKENNVKEVLVIEGDPPQTMLHQVYPTVSTDIIAKLKEEMPEVKVYAGIDQYRGSMKDEDYRIRRKLMAGAKGFFTQPFFDMRYLEIYADMLDGLDVYWGVSPVLSERSVSYWETKNHVVFPKDFEPTLEWNVAFARKVVAFAKERGHNVYIMPIKAQVMPYLEGVLR